MRILMVILIFTISLLIIRHFYVENKVFSYEVISNNFDKYWINNEYILGDDIDKDITKHSFREYKNYFGTIWYLNNLITVKGGSFIYIGNYSIIEDKVFLGERELRGIDADTFRMYNYGTFASDKNGYYVPGTYDYQLNSDIIPFFTGKNMNFFEDSYKSNYAIAGETLYYANKIVSGVDIQSFDFYPGQGFYYYDKTNIYYGSSIILNADKETFIAYPLEENIYERDAEDKNNKYLMGKIIE